MVIHSGPELCVAHREVWDEALTGETGMPTIEPRNQEIGMSTELTILEDNTPFDVAQANLVEPLNIQAQGERLILHER